MAQKCTVFPVLNKAYNALVENLGNNKPLALTMYFNIHDNSGVRNDFKDFFAIATGKKYKEEIKTDEDAEKYASVIEDYYYLTQKDVARYQKVAKNIDIAQTYGYAKPADREAGKIHVANIVLSTFMKKSSDSTFEQSRDNYIREIRTKWRANIFNYAINVLGDTRDKKTLKQEFNAAKDKAAFIEKLLGGKDMTDVAKNLYAVYKELMGDPDHTDAYFDDILCDSKLNTVRNKINGEKEVEVSQQPNEQDGDGNEVQNGQDAAVVDTDVHDDSFTVMNSHGGHYSTFMKHLSERVKNYFNTLPKLIDPKDDTSYDNNNSFGLNEMMDAAECTIIIYNKGPFDSAEDLLHKIEIIAETVPGYAAFAKLVKDLKEDNDLLLELRTTFGKIRTIKEQIQIDGTSNVLDVSNKESNPRTRFLYDIMNQTITFSIQLDHSYFIKEANRVQEDINSVGNKISTLYSKTNRSSESAKEALKNKIEEELDNIKMEPANVDSSYETDSITILYVSFAICNQCK